MIPVAQLPPLPPAAHIVLIHDNGGGRIDTFGRRVQAYIDHKSHVRVMGECDSACTMVTAVPNVCFGPDASLGFHQAYDLTDRRVVQDDDVENRSDAGTAFLEAFYPDRLKAWITGHGGLTSTMIYLRGRELFSLFRRCK